MTVFTADHRDRLRAARERKQKARQKMAAAREAMRIASEHQDPQASGHAEVALEQARGEESLAVELESALLHQLAGFSDAAGFGGESFLDNPEMVRALEQLAHSSTPIGRMPLGLAQSREGLLAMIQSGSWRGRSMAVAGDVDVPDTARVSPPYGAVPQLRRRLRLLDLIPSQPMDGESFTYTQESGSLDTAGETAEGAVKPEADLELADAQVVAKTIAHFIKLKRQQLADVPALGTLTQTRLTYGVMRRLENQIVAGDGTGEKLTGILNMTGVGDVAFAAGEPLSDLTLDAISAVLVSDAEPNGVVANPLDVATMLKAKASGSGERLDSDGAFATPPTTMWGLPLITSKVMPQGQALVGDWSVGCTLFVRQAVALYTSDSDQDDFVRNKVTMLGEGRFGLMIQQPTAFALVHYSA